MLTSQAKKFVLSLMVTQGLENSSCRIIQLFKDRRAKAEGEKYHHMPTSASVSLLSRS